MKYSLLTYWNIGFGLLLIIQSYAMYFMHLHVSVDIIQQLSLATLGLLSVTLGAMVAKKKVKINQSEIKEQS